MDSTVHILNSIMPQYAEIDSTADIDHQIRLKKCEQFFADMSQDFNAETLSTVIVYLHDTWSVVRNKCSKLLSEKAMLLNHDQLYFLVKTFSEYCKSSASWQEVHGSLLGFNAVVCGRPQIEGNTYHHIESVCLSLISHVSTPVREASRSCLFNIQKKVNDQHNFVFKLIFLISSILKSNHSASESSTLTLDGILGCLVDSFQEFPTLIIQFDVPFLNLIDPISEKGDDVSRINQPTVEFIDTIKMCMLHEASSVRQKAGQVLIILLTNLLNGSHVVSVEPSPRTMMPMLKRSSSNHSTFSSALVEYIVSRVLIESLRSTRSDDWRLQEICLMVSEEVLSISLKNKIEELRCGLDTALGISASIVQLVKFLKEHLGFILCHESFEVRRMATQILPLLARVAVLFESPTSCPVISGIDVSSSVFIVSRPSSGVFAPVTGGGLASLRASRDEYQDGGRGTPTRQVTPTKQHITSIITFAEGPVMASGGAAAPAAAVSSMDPEEARAIATLVRVMWLAEVLKQNQHLVEVCPARMWELLKTSYRSSCTFSGDEGDHSTAENGANASAGNSETLLRSWEPLDSWSLEVPGRLFEIDNRTQFQKDMRSLLNDSGENTSKVMVDKLCVNLNAILAGIGEVLSLCESVYCINASETKGGLYVEGAEECDSEFESSDKEDEGDYLYGGLASIANNYSSGGNGGVSARGIIKGLLKLKTDKVQCLLMSNDFIECNVLILNYLTNLLVTFGVDAGATSTNKSFLSVVHTSADYLSRSKALLSCWSAHAFRINSLVDNSVSKAINLNSVTTATTTTSSAASDGGSKLKTTRSFTVGLHGRQRFCSCDSAACSSVTIASVGPVRSLEACTLIPSLSDPATDPLIFLESRSSQRVVPVYSNNYSKPNTPSAALSRAASQSNPATGGGSAVLVPSVYGGSKAVVLGASGYMSMNRWNCEALSPLVGCLAQLQLHFKDSFLLSQILVEWIIACQLNSLWLDRRTFCKKNLFDTLSVLVVNATNDAEWSGACCNNQQHFLAAQLLRTLAEALALKSSVGLEGKQVFVLVKAAVQLATSLLSFEPAVDNQAASDPIAAECKQEVSALLRESVTVLSASCTQIERRFTEEEASRSDVGAKIVGNETEAKDKSKKDEPSDDEDEFSDWDESSSVESDALQNSLDSSSNTDFNKSSTAGTVVLEVTLLGRLCQQLKCKY